MYKIFIRNIEGFKKIFKDDERSKLAKPLYLLRDLNVFTSNKSDNTSDYQRLQRILSRAYALKETPKYHSFGMFFTELQLQYFEIDLISSNPDEPDEELDHQVDILHQFIFPAYYCLCRKICKISTVQKVNLQCLL